MIFRSASAPGCSGNLACAGTHVYEGIYQGIPMGFVVRVNVQDVRHYWKGSLVHLQEAVIPHLDYSVAAYEVQLLKIFLPS